MIFKVLKIQYNTIIYITDFVFSFYWKIDMVVNFYSKHLLLHPDPVLSSEATDSKTSERNTPSPIDPDAIEVDINFQPDPTDLVLSSVPGGELFNPRKHKFSDEELKPQPMIKKAKKVFVPDEQKVG